MPKSSLSGERLIHSEASHVSELPKWRYDLLIDNLIVSIDLSELEHKLCNPSCKKANRLQELQCYARNFKHELIQGTSQSTVYTNFLKFKQYLIWCDSNGLPPFCALTWRKHYNYLWDMVVVGGPEIPLWELSNGHLVGLKERSAKLMASTVKQALLWCNQKVNQWEKQLRPFRNSKPESYQAYSDEELKVTLSRLSSYFFQLVIPLLDDDIPKRIAVEIDGQSFDVSLESENTKGKAKSALLNADIAFNQAMGCAYYLLSYFTAFNTSQLIELRHPIEWKKQRTSEFYKLNAFKKRANREVISVVGGETHKKSIKFIETLIALSLKFNQDENGFLLYWLDSNGEPQLLSSRLLAHANLTSRLLLLSDSTYSCLPYLFGIHRSFIENSPKGFVEFDEISVDDRKVIRKTKKISRFYARRITTLSIILFYTMIATHPKNKNKIIKLKGAVLPLNLTAKHDEIEVTIRYLDGSTMSYFVDEDYGQFLIDVEKYALLRQKKRLKKRRYLFPLGSVNNPTQWVGSLPGTGYLSTYGIASGQFFVNLSSSRFRETAAKLVRRKANRTELQISQILNNQYQTVIKHYSEGNHYDNQLIIAQGLSTIEKVSKGQSVEQAKSEVASESQVEVIKFDEMMSSGAKLNGVGIACLGKEAKKQKQNELNSYSPCFDYSNCIKCEFAKLVDDVEPLYRLLSFLECMEESWLYFPERFTRNIGKAIELYRKIVTQNLSKKVITEAQFKLDTEGRHMLWNNLELASLGYKGL